MPLPHFSLEPKFKLGDYREYVYVGEDMNAKEYIWDENIPIILQKNTVYKLFCKIYEENIRGTLSYLSEYYTNKPPKGEIVVVVAGKKD